MSKRCRRNSSGTGTSAIPGFQTRRENLEVPGDPLAQPVPAALAAQEALEVLEAPRVPAALVPLGVLWVLAALGVRAALESQFGILGPSPTGRGPCRDLRTLHELQRRRPAID